MENTTEKFPSLWSVSASADDRCKVGAVELGIRGNAKSDVLCPIGECKEEGDQGVTRDKARVDCWRYRIY